MAVGELLLTRVHVGQTPAVHHPPGAMGVLVCVTGGGGGGGGAGGQKGVVFHTVMLYCLFRMLYSTVHVHVNNKIIA